MHDSFPNAGCHLDARLCDRLCPIVYALLSSIEFFLSSKMEPTHRYVCPKVQNGHNIQKTRRSFFVWLDNLN
jgi:hypothetical protein